MYTALYLEINFICVCIAALILVRMKRSVDKRTQNLAFFQVAFSILLLLLLDVAWSLVEGRVFPGARLLNGVINAVYLFMAGFIGYLWLCYVECLLHCEINSKPLFRVLLLLPQLGLLALCVSSIWTGAMFSIDADNIYHRGSLHFVQLVVSYSYLLAAAVHVLCRMFREKYRQTRRDLAPLLGFAALPALGGAISALYYGLPLLWPMATLALLLVFVNFQDSQISRDGLTGLNNRRQFDNYLRSVLSESHQPKRFALFMLDIDNFKHINDSYGHLCGDEALTQTAQLLQGACKSRDAFLARYGGDEFVILYYCSGDVEAVAFQRDVRAVFREYELRSRSVYRLALSSGYALFDPANPVSGEALIAAADEALYREKRARKGTAAAR